MSQSASTPASTGSNTAAAPAFNFCCLVPLLHDSAYKSSSDPLKLTHGQYHAYMTALDTVENVAASLHQTEAGVAFLLEMLQACDIDSYTAQALRGLLSPIAKRLAQHAAALDATIAK